MLSNTSSYSYTVPSSASSSACLAFCARDSVAVETLPAPRLDEVEAIGAEGGGSSSSSAPREKAGLEKAEGLGVGLGSLAPPKESLTGAKPDMLRETRTRDTGRGRGARRSPGWGVGGDPPESDRRRPNSTRVQLSISP